MTDSVAKLVPIDEFISLCGPEQIEPECGPEQAARPRRVDLKSRVECQCRSVTRVILARPGVGVSQTRHGQVKYGPEQARASRLQVECGGPAAR